MVGNILLGELAKDRDQLFAEAVAAFMRGEGAVLPQTLWADAAEMQKKRRIVDDWEDMLRPIFFGGVNKKSTIISAVKTLQLVNGTQTVNVLFAASQDIAQISLGLQGRDLRGQTGQKIAEVMRRLEWGQWKEPNIGRGYIHALPGDPMLDESWED
jgi:predicted P-loop ATPase